MLKVPPKAVVVTCGSTFAIVCPGVGQPPARGVTYYYRISAVNATSAVAR